MKYWFLSYVAQINGQRIFGELLTIGEKLPVRSKLVELIGNKFNTRVTDEMVVFLNMILLDEDNAVNWMS